MDFSKQGGGTRVHDKVKLRALATGVGQSQGEAHRTGSSRMQRVVENLKPGQHVSAPALHELAERKRTEEERMGINAHMTPPTNEERARTAWPLESMHHKTHEEAGTITAPQPSDQGEQERVHTTGRANHPGMQISPTVK